MHKLLWGINGEKHADMNICSGFRNYIFEATKKVRRNQAADIIRGQIKTFSMQ